MWTESGGVDLNARRGITKSDETSRRWNITKACYKVYDATDSYGGFYLVLKGERRRDGYYRVLAAEDSGELYWRSGWYSSDDMYSYGYEDYFEMDFNGNGVVGDF